MIRRPATTWTGRAPRCSGSDEETTSSSFWPTLFFLIPCTSVLIEQANTTNPAHPASQIGGEGEKAYLATRTIGTWLKSERFLDGPWSPDSLRENHQLHLHRKYADSLTFEE